MIPEIEYQLKRVYPSGFIYEINQEALIPDFYHSLISEALSEIIVACDVNISDISPFFKNQFLLTITPKNSIDFLSWALSLFEKKKQWLTENTSGYQILYLHFSRVWPGYIIDYSVNTLDHEKNCLKTKCFQSAPTEY